MNESLTWALQKSVRVWVVALVFLGLGFMLWDALGFDLAVSALIGDATGFEFRGNWFFKTVMHDAVRWLAWGLLGCLAWSALKARDRLLQKDARWALAGVVIAVLIVQFMKRSSTTTCPWDLQMFGGSASYVSHWMFGSRDNGPGNCFPAGHPLVAFGFLPAWVALQFRLPKPRLILACIIAAGLLFGFVQVLRGAHFISHVLWTGWICAAVAGALGAARLKNVRTIG